MRRLPLWLTLVPLILGLGLYWYLWSGWATAFKAEVAAWLPGSAIEVSGFPYRIEGSAANPHLDRPGPVSITASAAQAIVNRGPWQPDLTVVRTVGPRLTVAVGGKDARTAMRADVAGLTALTSINTSGGRIARLSTVIEAARGRIGIITPMLGADTLEVHLREVAGRLPEPWSPTLPAHGQAVISAERLRIGGGDALTLASDMAITGSARLTDFARWADGGTVEVRLLTLSDAHGEIVAVRATLVPVGLVSVRMAGTIDTICPEAVVAAFLNQPAPKALRLRLPVRLSFDAVAGGIAHVNVTGVPGDLATRARRTQLPACPVLRG